MLLLTNHSNKMSLVNVCNEVLHLVIFIHRFNIFLVIGLKLNYITITVKRLEFDQMLDMILVFYTVLVGNVFGEGI